ncbi:3-ketoacyl-CoA synthase 5-like [Prosopis cineraria]|uniref:3-ketoacyl-CoA synthase 5-like n=1 Tax=Prosopis cineraria TaxID=364024 RepID=UPI0024109382|nr:3-ketoacyl-CoA synthase 5-like [Prosopis cineraria]
MEATISKQNQVPISLTLSHAVNYSTLFTHHFLPKLSHYLCLLTLSLLALFLLQNSDPIMLHFLLLCIFLLCFLLKHLLSKPSSVYLVDFSCLKPPGSCRVPFSSFLENTSLIGFDRESIAFMAKILTSSGQSELTCLPPALHYIPPKTHQSESFREAQMVLFPIIDDLLAKINLSPLDIDILIFNCSGFCPVPSLSSMIINKYSMRSDVKSYNISGMGCTASAIGIDLAKNLLSVHKNSNAIIISTEILSTGWYSGNERSKLIMNCLFRMGSAAILLSNKKEAKKCSKYRVVSTVRTHMGFDDQAYTSAFREEDSQGKLGVTLQGDLLKVVGETLRSNFSNLGSEILPFSEKFRYVMLVLKKKMTTNKSESVPAPNFKTVIKHFCLPCSGRAVIREIGKGLGLTESDMEPALMTLHRFGNQSSSSLWYELSYLEAKERVEKGDKIWQFGMGSGTKCCNVILECVRPITGESNKGPWADSIHQYPI